MDVCSSYISYSISYSAHAAAHVPAQVTSVQPGKGITGKVRNGGKLGERKVRGPGQARAACHAYSSRA
jgi:hypothetical protein